MAISLGGKSNNSDAEWDAPIMAEINITPLTDIFLVLLIIFMVTSSVMSQSGMDVDLPGASNNTTAAQPDGVIVTLLANGRMKVNENEIGGGDWSALKKNLRQAFKLTDKRLVILEGDRKTLLGNAVRLMDEARRAGAETFAIATKPLK